MTDKNVVENFITHIIDEDLANKKHTHVVTRFPPEPNGYLHIGHAKSICLNFGVADDYQGTCHLRFDDTNPEKESKEYAESIIKDIKWLGFDWQGKAFHASDYFDQLYLYAEQLINKGLAYVDDQSPEEMRENRGDFNRPGIDSPFRERSVDENLELFRAMKAGEYADGQKVLRAKIDMQSGNINMRDPVLYRIKRMHHINTGDKWCIYPMYDFTHCLSDAIEGITHSLCTLEFEDHRPLYDWVIDNVDISCHPQQIEFSRLNLSFTITSKRRLSKLVEEQVVDGWNDPRMSTISGLRRRGYPPAGIREFIKQVGVSKKESVISMTVLEDAIRHHLNIVAPRVMGVLRPLKVVIENYPEDQVEMLEGANHPQDESFGSREIPFSRVIYVEQSDYKENANRKFFRLTEGREVRLRHAYYITCREAIKNEAGEVVELRCTYDPESRGGTADGRKVKGTIHWISAQHAEPIEVRLYDRLFNHPKPASLENFMDAVNPDSLEILPNAMLEPGIAGADDEVVYQFERNAYFKRDKTHETDKPIYNQVVTMRDSWAKMEQEGS
ncbi:glutamine--tRNA ligase/YqeY domain fusion protein [Marinicella sp. S1101]|uniref:glutamine--tRNA ligase/YqeY domain fusion protein n=1 Tax=Marinicella marina TaxID=2996016 RepID=UPI002260E1A6|nr:glutamine--tRNA ligase/YqeY domain fusion protein [Marinicella marina]MCX7554167.1 glutamine--tRNA ligase/YqeY domain fusion protein [Marinicella marina]MDJ1141140.1 glutamine--tRNA ligase/YqeY domain fusion protein [Marinicella marina]